MVAVIAGRGTPETAWRPFLAQLAPPPLKFTAPPHRAVVLAPHPDDEVLGVGGLLALLARAGNRVEIVAVTDGEASHPGSDALSPAALARTRAAETVAALAALGLPAAVRRLGLPDGGADALEPSVAEALLDGQPPDHPVRAGDWLIAPWAGDGHPDHEAVGRAALTVAARTGAQLIAYPIWAWHWAHPGGSQPGMAPPWDRAAAVALPSDVRRAKADAVRAFRSQLEPLGPDPADAPILSREVLARFTRPFEVVFR